MKNVALFSPPRSGSSWIGSLIGGHPKVVFRFQPLFSFGHRGAIKENSTGAEIEEATLRILNSDDSFATMRDSYFDFMPHSVRTAEDPSHLLWKETRFLQIAETLLKRSDYTVIGLLRNPFDTLSSWMGAPREFSSDWKISEEWLNAPKKNSEDPDNWFGFKKWLEAALLFLRLELEYPERFMILTYDEFINNPHKRLKEALSTLELEDHRQVHELLDSTMTRADSNPYSIFKSSKTLATVPHEIEIQIKDILSSSMSSEALRLFGPDFLD